MLQAPPGEYEGTAVVRGRYVAHTDTVSQQHLALPTKSVAAVTVAPQKPLLRNRNQFPPFPLFPHGTPRGIAWSTRYTGKMISSPGYRVWASQCLGGPELKTKKEFNYRGKDLKSNQIKLNGSRKYPPSNAPPYNTQYSTPTHTHTYTKVVNTTRATTTTTSYCNNTGQWRAVANLSNRKTKRRFFGIGSEAPKNKDWRRPTDPVTRPPMRSHPPPFPPSRPPLPAAPLEADQKKVKMLYFTEIVSSL